MAAGAGGAPDPGVGPEEAAAVVVDAGATVVSWPDAAERLLGTGRREAVGRPLWELLVPARDAPAPAMDAEEPFRGRGEARGGLPVVFTVLPQPPTPYRVVLVRSAAAELEDERALSVLRALMRQDRVGVGLHDRDLRLVLGNAPAAELSLPDVRTGAKWDEALFAPDAKALRRLLTEVLRTGEPAQARRQLLRPADAPLEQPGSYAVSAFRLEDARGRPAGVLVQAANTTEQQRDREHLALLYEAAAHIGSRLDVRSTAQELADVLVPALGGLVTVDLAEAVFAGDEPPRTLGGRTPHLVRAAVATASGEWPQDLLTPGDSYPAVPDSPELRRLQEGRMVTMRRPEIERALGGGSLVRRLVPERASSVTVAPLLARGRGLGTVSLWHMGLSEPVADELRLLMEICSRASLGIDNARRYTREHRAAVALQRRLLPRAVTDTPALEAAGTYRPAAGGANISGDWYDVITLPSLRAALVIGDVIGHGLTATATMGRLRTAILTLADLELDPAEVLTRLDDLVQRLAADSPGDHPDTFGATCLYAVYDPVQRNLTVANAGHPPPLISEPGAEPAFIDVPPGPPLGVGGVPFESVTRQIAPGSVLALFTDGLFGPRGVGVDTGLTRVRERFGSLQETGLGLGEIGDGLLRGTGGDNPPRDDTALLVARTRTVPAADTAHWQLPADPSSVGVAREEATRQLERWDLEHLTLPTELIVSELVTNAVRYAGGPVGVRLIRGPVLICEVSDPSNTQPRLVRATDTDEGGRGLYIVAQCASRWGSRYGQRGKTIWTEQSLRPGALDLLP
ncbi:SpoIIE family protein phosphatase [Streptomyces sp. NPDC050560]|uniref:SpoIIE family protein phosphatase n=1 Tax=Streptomyces sp. NPDC050560 TaxID=3365630 RepID=UPI003789AF2F